MMPSTHAATTIRPIKQFYRGYHSEAEPILHETHDPDQWHVQKSRSERVDEMPWQIVCGFIARKFLSDEEDLKR